MSDRPDREPSVPDDADVRGFELRGWTLLPIREIALQVRVELIIASAEGIGLDRGLDARVRKTDSSRNKAPEAFENWLFTLAFMHVLDHESATECAESMFHAVGDVELQLLSYSSFSVVQRSYSSLISCSGRWVNALKALPKEGALPVGYVELRAGLMRSCRSTGRMCGKISCYSELGSPMVPFLIFVILSLLVGLLTSWRRNRTLFPQPGSASQVGAVERTTELEKANEDLKRAQAELQRRWQYLAEAQRLSHSGTFGWKVRSGELVWSDETYRILGFTRETNPTLDLVFDRIHPEDRDRLQQIRDRATQNGMDLDMEHRILLPDGVIRYVHAVAHAGRDSSGNLEYMGVVSDITERKRDEEERQALSRNLHESKARLEEAQRVAHMGHYYWDLIADRVIWSDELYRIYGLTPQEGAH